METTTLTADLTAGFLGTYASGTAPYGIDDLRIADHQQLVQQYQQAYQQQAQQAYTAGWSNYYESWHPPKLEKKKQHFIDELRSEIDEWLKVA